LSVAGVSGPGQDQSDARDGTYTAVPEANENASMIGKLSSQITLEAYLGH
jgi:hypothetical protein